MRSTSWRLYRFTRRSGAPPYLTRLSQGLRTVASPPGKNSVDNQVRNRFVTTLYQLLPPAPAAAGVGAGRISTAVRGNVNVPPASSITLIWQTYSPGFRPSRGTSN